MAKTVINHLRIPLKPNESQTDALKRAQLEKNISDEQLKEYQVHFIAYTPVTLRAVR